MSKNSLKKKILFILFIFFNSTIASFSEIIILSDCKNLKDGFIKNEYILDLEKSLMTRNYIYNEKTYKKYRTTDLSVKKENTIERYIYTEKKFMPSNIKSEFDTKYMHLIDNQQKKFNEFS